MATIKHVGRIKSTGKKVVVAYRTLPGEAHSALVIQTENLDDAYHNALISTCDSVAGQEAYEFAEAMNRTQTPDGYNMLQAFHLKGLLRKVPTGDVEMLPSPGVVILLSELNQIIAEQRGVAVDDLSLKSGVQEVATAKTVETKEVPKATSDAVKTTSSSVNQEAPATSFDSPEAEAKYYRSQADKLAKEAAAMRRKAEELAPTKKKTTESA